MVPRTAYKIRHTGLVTYARRCSNVHAKKITGSLGVSFFFEACSLASKIVRQNFPCRSSTEVIVYWEEEEQGTQKGGERRRSSRLHRCHLFRNIPYPYPVQKWVPSIFRRKSRRSLATRTALSSTTTLNL